AIKFFVAGQHHVIAGIDAGFPAGLDDDGLVGFDDQRRAGKPVTRPQAVAADDAGVAPLAVRIDLPGLAIGDIAGRERMFGLAAAVLAVIEALDRDRFDDDG